MGYTFKALLLASLIATPAVHAASPEHNDSVIIKTTNFNIGDQKLSGTDLLGEIDRRIQRGRPMTMSAFSSTEGGTSVTTYCGTAKPTVTLDTCDALGLSQPSDITQHPAYYANPNDPGCSLSLSLPGLPTWDGNLDAMISGLDLCEMAEEYLSEVSGQITQSINSQLEQSFNIDENGNIAGIIQTDGSAGVGLGSTTQDVGLQFGGNSISTASNTYDSAADAQSSQQKESARSNESHKFKGLYE